MVGAINNKFFIEFRDEQELLAVLNRFADREDFTSWAIKSGKKIIAQGEVSQDDKYIEYPKILGPDTRYKLVMNEKNIYDEEIQEKCKEKSFDFIYKSCRTAQEFN